MSIHHLLVSDIQLFEVSQVSKVKNKRSKRFYYVCNPTRPKAWACVAKVWSHSPLAICRESYRLPKTPLRVQRYKKNMDWANFVARKCGESGFCKGNTKKLAVRGCELGSYVMDWTVCSTSQIATLIVIQLSPSDHPCLHQHDG